MIKDDTNCYTIKQIDDYLASSGLTGFALESERDRLIERLKARLGHQVDPMSDVYSPYDRMAALMDIGFSRYSKMMIYLNDGRKVSLTHPQKFIRYGFCQMGAKLIESGLDLHDIHFVFCSESIELKFDTIPGLNFGIELFYDSPSVMYIDAMLGKHTQNYTPKPEDPSLYVHEVAAFDMAAVMEFINTYTDVWKSTVKKYQNF